MAQNLIVNGIIYNGVDSLSMRNTGGKTVKFVEENASSGDGGGGTCTLAYLPGSSGFGYVIYPTPTGYVEDYWYEGNEVSNVTCGSLVYFYDISASAGTLSGTDGVELVASNYNNMFIAYLPNSPGETIEIGID